MSMTLRDRLEEAARLLEGWEKKIADRARPFHQRRLAALEKVRKPLDSRLGLLFAGQRDMQAALAEARSVEILGNGLQKELKRASELTARLAELTALARTVDSGAFAARAEERYNQWHTQLESTGINLTEASELAPVRESLGEMEIRIKKDSMALDLLRDAAELTQKLPDVYRDGLRSELNRWREQFLTEALSHHWINQVRGNIDLYRKEAQEQKISTQPDPSRDNLAEVKQKLLIPAENWSELLWEFRDDLPPVTAESLPTDSQDRIQKLSKDIENEISKQQPLEDAVAAIRGELTGLLEQLQSSARERARVALASLRKQFDLFVEVCAQAASSDDRLRELKSDIDALNPAEIHVPNDIENFAQNFADARKLFQGLTVNERSSLALGAARAVESCENELNRLFTLAAPQGIRQELHGYRNRIPEAPRGSRPAEDSLHALELCDHILSDLAQLEKRGEAAREEFLQRRRRDATELESIAGLFQDLGKPVGRPLETARETLGTIAEFSTGAEFGAYERHLATSEESVGKARKEGLKRAARRIQALSDFFVEADRGLHAAGVTPPPALAAPDGLAQREVEDVRAVLRQFSGRDAVIREEMRRAVGAMQEQCQDASELLEKIRAGLASGDSKLAWAQELLGEYQQIQTRDFAPEPSVLESSDATAPSDAFILLDLARWLESFRSFHENLLQNEQQARQLQKKLRGTLSAIQRDSREKYCPSLFARARALAEGVPDRPVSWEQAVAQLKESDELLRLADREAQRRITWEMRRVALGLEQRFRRSSDEALKLRIRTLLDRLRAQGDEATPPVSVRRPLLFLAREINLHSSPFDDGPGAPSAGT